MKNLFKDYRLPENREEYFTQLYKMNLEERVMPGLVYLYMPALAHHFGWDMEQKLWFAFINGNTQNPITSLRIFNEFPVIPAERDGFLTFKRWFDDNWDTLSFDVDRRYQKKELPLAVFTYSSLVTAYGSQEKLLAGTFSELWDRVTKGFHSFGRLAAFSYLEYIKIMGAGAECDEMFWQDKSGSKSHRNGMLFLLGQDEFVWDKRANNGFDGNYDSFARLCVWLGAEADHYLEQCGIENRHKGYFTLESQLCQFKNGFFGRRYPGVYADMALDRIKWYDDRGFTELTSVFKDIRAEYLPHWLREECEEKVAHRVYKATMFKETGIPFRAKYFMEEVK